MVKISHDTRANKLSFDFTPGNRLDIDLKGVKVSEEQSKILAKAIDRMKEVRDPGYFIDGECPSKPFLEADEFDKIKTLRKVIGSTGGEVAAGIIVDFCLHVLVVGRRRPNSNPV